MSFEYELSSRRKILLYLYQICPVIDVIDKIHNMKLMLENKEVVDWYIDIFPFKDKTNKTYMLWFVREFNIFSKISDKELGNIRDNHRSIFEKITSTYINDIPI